MCTAVLIYKIHNIYGRFNRQQTYITEAIKMNLCHAKSHQNYVYLKFIMSNLLHEQNNSLIQTLLNTVKQVQNKAYKTLHSSKQSIYL